MWSKAAHNLLLLEGKGRSHRELVGHSRVPVSKCWISMHVSGIKTYPHPSSHSDNLMLLPSYTGQLQELAQFLCFPCGNLPYQTFLPYFPLGCAVIASFSLVFSSLGGRGRALKRGFEFKAKLKGSLLSWAYPTLLPNV